ncbi:MAG: GGDEF domain-containing protein [Sphaerochaeta sp.]
MKNTYRLSSILTVALSLIGTWGAIYIDSRLGLTEFFPLIYVTITVLLSSVLLSLFITIIIASVQLVVLVTILSNTPALMAYNWASFISFVLILSVLSIVANYISSFQLKRFKENSIRDHLTGLLNRRYFDVTLEDKVHRSESKEITYGVMLMDIDNFKKYNDQYNHATGDIILQKVSSFLVGTLEASAIACRYGGDEFAIIIIDTDYAHLYEIAQKLRTGAKQVDITDTCKTGEQLSISIGLALFPENGNTPDLLMAHADRNLMLAKELGKDLVMPR